MKAESPDTTSGLDRLATSDEIRAAAELYSGSNDEDFVETALLIPDENGGYVRISAEDFEYASLINEITRLLR